MTVRITAAPESAGSVQLDLGMFEAAVILDALTTITGVHEARVELLGDDTVAGDMLETAKDLSGSLRAALAQYLVSQTS